MIICIWRCQTTTTQPITLRVRVKNSLHYSVHQYLNLSQYVAQIKLSIIIYNWISITIIRFDTIAKDRKCLLHTVMDACLCFQRFATHCSLIFMGIHYLLNCKSQLDTLKQWPIMDLNHNNNNNNNYNYSNNNNNRLWQKSIACCDGWLIFVTVIMDFYCFIIFNWMFSLFLPLPLLLLLLLLASHVRYLKFSKRISCEEESEI